MAQSTNAQQSGVREEKTPQLSCCTEGISVCGSGTLMHEFVLIHIKNTSNQELLISNY